VIFLVFNNYTSAQTTNGHKYSGFVEGGPCENNFGRGYAVIVDQGIKELKIGFQHLLSSFENASSLKKKLKQLSVIK
jgi:hypothetical protein